MADLASTDVTISITTRKTLPGIRLNFVSVAYGDSTKKYPAGGIPLPALSTFGLPAGVLWDLQLTDQIDGYVRKYDKANHKLRIFQSAGFTPAGTITNGTPDTFAGTAGPAAPLVELGNVAIAPTTLYAMVHGK
jgi:hypothetical protein